MATKRFTPGPDTARNFRDALGRFTTGVTIVTCQSDRGPLGITANSFASVSLDPPLVLWSPARASKRFSAFAEAATFNIHILSEDQRDLCTRFTTEGLDFSGIETSSSRNDVPLLLGALAVFECERHAIHEGGDHAIIVGHVRSVLVNDGAPLVFSSGNYGSFLADH